MKFYTPKVHWKNQCRSTIRKHSLLWNKQKYQHPNDIFVKNVFTHFMALVSFYTTWNTLEIHQEALKETSVMKRVKNNFIFSYLFCYLFKFVIKAITNWTIEPNRLKDFWMAYSFFKGAIFLLEVTFTVIQLFNINPLPHLFAVKQLIQFCY